MNNNPIELNSCNHDLYYWSEQEWECYKCQKVLSKDELKHHLIETRNCNYNIASFFEIEGVAEYRQLSQGFKDLTDELIENDVQVFKAYTIIQNHKKAFNAAWNNDYGNGYSIIEKMKGMFQPPEEPTKRSSKKKVSARKRKRIYENDKYRCKKCGTHKDLSIDHIIPESKGGSHDDKNLQTLCLTCNKSKGIKNNEEFMSL